MSVASRASAVSVEHPPGVGVAEQGDGEPGQQETLDEGADAPEGGGLAGGDVAVPLQADEVDAEERGELSGADELVLRPLAVDLQHEPPLGPVEVPGHRHELVQAVGGESFLVAGKGRAGGAVDALAEVKRPGDGGVAGG